MYLVMLIQKILFHQSKKLNLIIFSQNNVNINFSIKINLFKPRKEKIKNYEPSAPPEYKFQ